MALAAGTIWDTRNGGDDANGGGFNPANSSMATDLAATSATGASPVVTSASYTFVAGDVGHWVFVKSGTNWTPGWYQIASVNAGAATLSAAAGAAYLASDSKPSTVTTAAGCATTASPTGGTWSVDYSQTAAARYSFTDLVINGSTNTDFTSSANPVGKNFVGNIINVTAGTGFTVQRVEVASVTGTTGRADKSMGTLSSTGGTGKLGGCFASPGQAGAVHVDGNLEFVQYHATAYSLTNSANVSGGRWSTSAIGAFSRLVGWETTRTVYNNDSNWPTLRAGANSVVCVTLGGADNEARNLIADNVGAFTSTKGFSLTTRCRVTRCKAAGHTGNSFDCGGSGGAMIADCEATTQNGGNAAFYVTAGCKLLRCNSHDQVNAPGFYLNTADAILDDCIADSNAGHGFLMNGNAVAKNCTAYGATGANDGFNVNSVGTGECVNCIAVSNGSAGSAYGFNLSAVGTFFRLINCATYGNRTAATNNLPLGAAIGLITLTGDPFNGAGAGDFSLNSTAGAGAACRGTGYPATFPAGLTSSYPDVGVSQSQAAAAGSGAAYAGSMRMGL